jgi:hypothetical protein
MEMEQEVVEQEQPLIPADEAVSSAQAEEVVESAPAEEPTPEVKAGASDESIFPEKVQKRIDDITFRRYEAERERDYWKLQAEARLRAEQEAQQPQVTPEPVIPSSPAPRQEDFETYEQYDEALFDWRYQQRVARETVQRQQEDRKRAEREYAEHVRSWAEQGAEKYPDFSQVALKEPRDGGPSITPYMAGAIQDSPMGHEVAYYPKEAAKIAQLSPIAQVREIGRLEIKVQTPQQRETTKAPTPTSPVGGKESPSVKLEDMTYEEYKAYRMKQRGKGS